MGADYSPCSGEGPPSDRRPGDMFLDKVMHIGLDNRDQHLLLFEISASQSVEIHLNLALA